MKKIKEFDIKFSDLIPETRKKLFKFFNFKNLSDGKYRIFPIATISREDIVIYQERQGRE